MRRTLTAFALIAGFLWSPAAIYPAVAATQTCQGAQQCAALAASCARQGGRFTANTRVNGQVSGSCTT